MLQSCIRQVACAASRLVPPRNLARFRPQIRRFSKENKEESREFLDYESEENEEDVRGMKEDGWTIYVKPGSITLDQVRPSERLLSRLDEEQLRKYKYVCAELELYLYLGQIIPDVLTDQDWTRLLTMRSTQERVAFWEYRGLTCAREKRDKIRAEKKRQEHQKLSEKFDEAMRIIEEGGMGYAPQGYRLIQNPLRNQADGHRLHGARMYYSIALLNNPRVIVDMRDIPFAQDSHRRHLSAHIREAIRQNNESNRPLPLSFAGIELSESMKNYLKYQVGYFDSAYDHQRLTPDLSAKPPQEMYDFDRDEVVYISKYAKDMLDGPLDKKAYIVPATMDLSRESLGLGRKSRVQMFCLPIKKYVIWRHGPMFIPLPTIVKILREVNTHGNWEEAFHKSISRRHLHDSDEKFEQRQSLFRERREEKKNLIKSIEEYMDKKREKGEI
ncbi:hypothetical protein WR25_21556 [Diploscapter pachys]|uniref:SAM-dependent MTase TRM10-type domain-containing protein n=1 Tax=Diploscapter pachys TaxID=2018661 RepID=A0A2A2JP15_9BILA|nr:hypothetical protein WR25_21556 [Diploscapter pachys]